MSQKIFDNIIRSALWTSYNYTCFYCTQSLEWGDLHIDHIIPEYLAHDKEKFDQIKFEYELDKNFDLDAFYNLVPTHSKCNQRKNDSLYPKASALFYINLTLKSISRIETEIEKLKRRKDKGQIISKLQSALSANLITSLELKAIMMEAEKNLWDIKAIKLPKGVDFIDDVYDLFYLNTDCSILLDKKLLFGGVYDYLELANDNEDILNISTLREWKNARKKGYYPANNASIKMSSNITFLEEFLKALEKAKMPKVSFVSEPWIDIDNLDYLSPNVIHDFEENLRKYIKSGTSVGDLVRQKIITINENDNFKISLEFEGMETSLIEIFRADFNNDGIEDIFVSGATRAIKGTFCVGFTTILTRYSEKHLIDYAKK